MPVGVEEVDFLPFATVLVEVILVVKDGNHGLAEGDVHHYKTVGVLPVQERIPCVAGAGLQEDIDPVGVRRYLAALPGVGLSISTLPAIVKLALAPLPAPLTKV